MTSLARVWGLAGLSCTAMACRSTGGQYFRARDAEELQAIREALDQLEPVAQQPTQARPAQALYCWPLALALLLSLALVGHELWPDLHQQPPNWLRRRS